MITQRANSATTLDIGIPPACPQLEVLLRVRYVAPEQFELTFGDNFTALLSLSQMGLKAEEIDVLSAKAIQDGIEFQSSRDRNVLLVDSPTLRYLADPTYA